jgi:hypothetical protein
VLLVTSTVDSIRGGRGGSPDEPVSAAAFLASIDSLSFLIKADSSSAVVAGFIVPLSSTEALVVQSHRAENWGAHLDPGTYGLAVYYVDTTKDVDRTDEGKGIVNETWSKYVGGETRYKRLLLVGDTATYKNIKVEFLNSGDNDLVRITKS